MKQTLVAATVALAGHPSAPNYLELVGGSNFGVSDDYWPNWVNGGCIDNAPGSTGCNGAVTPIAVPGMDNPVVATATDPVKHDSFVYFQNIELGGQEGLTLNEVKDFDGPHGLWADLQTDDVPNLAVIVPNQCHDMHGGVSGGTPICSTKTDAETALFIQQGDAAVAKLVKGIKASPVWEQGRNAVVLVYDENDYEDAPNTVVMLVETSYSANGKQSAKPYDHFSLLRTLEAGFKLPCLNHACDSTSKVMDDMFGG